MEENQNAAAPVPAATAAPSQPAPSPAPAAPPQPPSPGHGAAGTFDTIVRQENEQHAARAESMSTAEIKSAAEKLLADPKSAYWQSGPDHDHAVALVFRSRELAAAAEGNASEDLTTSARLANRALTLDKLPIPKEAMNPKVIESDGDLKNFMHYVDSENISTPLVTRMMTAYANVLTQDGVSDQSLAALENEFKGDLHPQQLALLKRWVREELNANIRKIRRR